MSSSFGDAAHISAFPTSALPATPAPLGGTPETEADASIGTFAAFGEFDASITQVEAIGVDSGSTLVKLCLQLPGGALTFATWPAPSQDRVVRLIADLTPTRIGVTGAGSASLRERVGRSDAVQLVEFEAWARGANELLARSIPTEEPDTSAYLLVSVGTGTSLMRVEGTRVERVGGTALGGGTMLGLGVALADCRTHAELIELAARGDRSRIDLLIGDLFEGDQGIPLLADATASSFGKLARAAAAGTGEPAARKPDLAAAAMALVAENVGLLSNAHADAQGLSRIVYGGATLLANAQIVDTLRLIGRVAGFETIVLPRSAHAGALGAMLAASDGSA